jgi:hypothetical protein
VTITWKTFWTVGATVLALSMAALAVTDVLWTPLAVVIAAVLAVVVLLLSHVIVDACEMWRETEDWQRRRVWLWTSAAGGAYAAWTITAALLPLTWLHGLIMVAALGILSVSVYWAAVGMEWRLRSVAPPRRPDAEDDEALLGPYEKVLAAALRRASLGFVRVLPGCDPLRSNAGSQFRARTQSKAQLARGERAGAQTELTPKHMEALAIALAEITGRDVESGWVRYRKEPQAGTYSITITNRDVMAEVIPYVDDPTPTSITEPALVGVEIDGREHRERLDQHSRAVGGSTSGKSSLFQCELAHATRCEDAIVWVGGVQKLYDLVAGWVEPYHGRDMRSPLDWIAHGQTDTLSMMASGMSVARWRQRQPLHLRKWRTILLYLDEFSFVAQSSQKIWFQGEWWTASRLASGLLRGAASGNVFVHFGSQRSTTDHYGDQGGDVVANIGVNYAFRSKDFAEVGRLTNDYKLPVPKSSGECYRFSDADPIHLKAPYIQTNDPSKPRLHNGVTLAEIAWSRRHLIQGGLTEAEGLTAAGPAYAARHQIVNDRFMTYLTHGDDTEMPEDPDAQGEVYDSVRSQLTALAEQHGLDLSRNDPQPSTPSEQRRPDAILALLKHSRAEEGLSAAQIAATLKDAGDATAEPGVIAPTLSRMHNQGKIARVAPGRYTALSHHDHPTT